MLNISIEQFEKICDKVKSLNWVSVYLSTTLDKFGRYNKGGFYASDDYLKYYLYTTTIAHKRFGVLEIENRDRKDFTLTLSDRTFKMEDEALLGNLYNTLEDELINIPESIRREENEREILRKLGV